VYITNICLFDYINILTMKRTTKGQKIMFSLEGFTAPVEVWIKYVKNYVQLHLDKYVCSGKIRNLFSAIMQQMS